MSVKHSDTLHTPISVDVPFIERLRALVTIARDRVMSDTSTKTGVSTKRIQEILDGSEPTDAAERAAKTTYDNANRLYIKLAYKGSKQLYANSIDECVEFLKDEFGLCQQFYLRYGEITGIQIELDFDDRFSMTTYEVRGDRQFIDTLHRRVVELIAESAPDHAMLHRKGVDIILMFLAAFSAAFIYLRLAYEFRSEIGLSFDKIVPTASVPFFLALSTFSSPLIRQYRKTFPLIQFEFGNQKKRRDASRKATFALLSAIVAPIVLSLIGF